MNSPSTLNINNGSSSILWTSYPQVEIRTIVIRLKSFCDDSDGVVVMVLVTADGFFLRFGDWMARRVIVRVSKVAFPRFE